MTQAIKMDSILIEVSRAFIKSANQKNRNNLRSKMQQTYNCKEQEAHRLNMMQQEDHIEPMPIYTNYWLAQSDPSYVDQEENITTITERRRKSFRNPTEGIKDYLGNWMSPDDVKKALQDRFPESISERSLYGVAYSIGQTDWPLSKIGVDMTNFPYIDASGHSKRRMETDVRAHGDRQIF